MKAGRRCPSDVNKRMAPIGLSVWMLSPQFIELFGGVALVEEVGHW